MITRSRSALLLAAAACLGGCASMHSLTPVSIDIGPAAREYRSPELEAFRYATFSVFPLAAVNPNAELKSEPDQRAVLYSVRSLLEANGYRFVPLSANPDFAVGVDASMAKAEGVTRKTVVQAPEWKPGDTIPSPPASLAALAATDTWGWGNLPDTSGAVTPLPGWPPRGGKKIRMGKRRYSIRVVATVVDAKSMTEVWVGTGSGITRIPDVRISSQLVSWMVLHQFPATAMTELTTRGGDIPGMSYEVLTNDGVNFYPGVIAVDGKSQAWKSGIVEYDMLLAVGGEPTWDRGWRDVRRMLSGPPDTRKALTLWRYNTQVNVEARRVPVATEDPGAVAPPPMTGEKKDKAKKQEMLYIPRTKVAVDSTWAILGALTIGALVAAIFSAQQ